MKAIMEHPGKLIYNRRRALKMSRRELVALSGVGKTALYDVENGKSSVQLDTLEKLCAVLGIVLTFETRDNEPPLIPSRPSKPKSIQEEPPSSASSEVMESEPLPDYLL